MKKMNTRIIAITLIVSFVTSVVIVPAGPVLAVTSATNTT